MSSSRIYISNISSDVKTRDIQELFSEYGRIVFIDIQGSSGYLEYEFPKEASKAVDNLNGENLKGKKITVEFAKRSNNNSSSYRNRDKPARARSQDKCYLCQDYGHWAVNCPKGDGIGVSGGKCFKCNERGHIARKCPNTRRKYSKSYSKSSRSSDRSRSRDDSRHRKKNQNRKQRSSSKSGSSRSKSYSRSESRRKRSRSSRKYKSDSLSRSVSKSVSYSLSRSKSRSKS